MRTIVREQSHYNVWFNCFQQQIEILNRFREFNNNCYAYRRLMCVQNIIVITQIFEIFCSCLFILVIQLFVVCNAFSVDWLISTRIRWSVTLRSRILSTIIALCQSFKLSFSCTYRGESSLFVPTASVIVIGSRYPSTFLIRHNWCEYIIIT